MASNSQSFKIRRTGYKNSWKSPQQLQEEEEVANLQDIDIGKRADQQKQTEKNKVAAVLHPAEYREDEESINCYRFPHASFCGCQPNCLLESFDPHELAPGLYFSNFVSGVKSKHLLDLGITHILNVTCKQYTKRKHYFKYQNIDLLNNTEEDAKKFFRISNRFIKSAVDAGGKVLIHASVLQIGVVMGCAYLIGILKISLKQCLANVAELGIEISPHFLKQLEAYDLQKMAFVSIQRQ